MQKVETSDMINVNIYIASRPYLCLVLRYSFWIVFTVVCYGSAEAEVNPFELRYKLSHEERMAMFFSQRNPFELIRGDEASALALLLPGVVHPSEKDVNELDLRYIQKPGFLFWFYLALLVCLTVLVNLNRQLTGRMFRAVLNEQTAIGLWRESRRISFLPFLLWYCFFFVIAGTFAYQIVNLVTKGGFPGDRPLFILWFSLGIGGFFTAFHSILRITGTIFPVDKALRTYSFYIMNLHIISSLLLYPVNILLTYLSVSWANPVLYFGLFIILIMLIMRLLRGFLIGFPYIISSPFHFIVYLCAIEIIPILLLVKWFL